MNVRIKLQDMCQTDTMPFHQHWEARTEFALKDVLDEPLFFSSFKDSLHIGGRITLIQYSKVAVKSSDNEGIRGIVILRVADIEKGSGKILFVIEDQITPVEKPVPDATIEDPGLTLKRIFPEDGYPYIAVDANGNTVERFKTKNDGEKYVNMGA